MMDYEVNSSSNERNCCSCNSCMEDDRTREEMIMKIKEYDF